MSSALLFSHAASSSSRSRLPARLCLTQKKAKARSARSAAPATEAPIATWVVWESEFHFCLMVCEAEGSLLPSSVIALVVLHSGGTKMLVCHGLSVVYLTGGSGGLKYVLQDLDTLPATARVSVLVLCPAARVRNTH